MPHVSQGSVATLLRCDGIYNYEPSLTAKEFLAHVHVRYMLSPIRLSVCNIRAPYLGGCNFQQYFYGILYPGHPLTSTKNFTEIVLGEPLRWGS